MMKLVEFFIIIKHATSDANKMYLTDEGQWVSNPGLAKEYETAFAGRTALESKLNDEEDVQFNIVYKVDGFLKTVYVR